MNQDARPRIRTTQRLRAWIAQAMASEQVSAAGAARLPAASLHQATRLLRHVRARLPDVGVWSALAPPGWRVRGTLDAKGKRRADFTAEELASYGGYCVNDVELTYAIFNQMIRAFPKVELKLIDLTLRMFTEPVLASGVVND